MKKARSKSGAKEGQKYGLWNICRGLLKHRAQIGSVQGPYVTSRMSLGSEQMQDQPEAVKKPKCGLSSCLQGLEELQNLLGSFQGNRCALRSVVGVMHKGRAQPDSVHRPRDGPKSIYWKLNKSCALGSDYERLYPLHDSAWFTVGT